MRISHNIAAMNTYRSYSKNAVAANKSMEKLSSGSRINRAADDAAGLSISEKMRSQIRGLTQATRNAEDGVSFIQTAEGALNEVSDMLTRIKELVVQVSNGTYSAADQANIGSEMSALGSAIKGIYTDTNFNGKNVFGQDPANGFVSGLEGNTAATIAYGENGAQTVDIKAAVTTNVKALTDATDGVASATADIATAVADLAADPSNTDLQDALDAANAAFTTAIAAVSSTVVESAITEVDTTRATYGAQQNQLEHVTNNMATTKENLQSAESRVRDVDMAEEMTEYTKNNILLQAAQSMLAQANAQPQGILQLLQ